MKNYFYPIRAVFACLLLVLAMTGCGRDQALTTYKQQMEQFFETVETCDRQINAIDATAEDAPEKLLQYLDSMNTAFSEMAEYDIPEAFSTLGELPKEAAGFMNDAVTKYHEAYDGEYDALAEEDAARLYERANVRLKYIISILHGEIPEGEDIEFVEE